MAKNGFGKAGRGDKAMQARWMKRSAQIAKKKKAWEVIKNAGKRSVQS